jgi:hypothetical protein
VLKKVCGSSHEEIWIIFEVTETGITGVAK